MALRIIKWLLAIAAIASFVAAWASLEDAIHIRDVMANGTEATAVVEGGKLGVRATGSDAYEVDLLWPDAAGTTLTAKRLPIVGVLGRQLIAGEAGEPPALLVKYLPEAPEGRPVIVRQAALDQEANRVAIVSRAITGALCAISFAVLAWLGRRRPA